MSPRLGGMVGGAETQSLSPVRRKVGGMTGTESRAEIGAMGGEQLAVDYLGQLGWRMLARNWRCRYGELDVIATDDTAQAVVFVEVKTRTGGAVRWCRAGGDPPCQGPPSAPAGRSVVGPAARQLVVGAHRRHRDQDRPPPAAPRSPTSAGVG